MDDLTNSLYQFLVDARRERDGDDAADRPLTVAEIYQELIPYREVREVLGFQLNADYEHTLLRLLAGEGGLLKLEPASARDELRQELASPNPYVGLYRKFAACDVWLAAPTDPKATTDVATDPATTAEPAAADDDPAPVDGSADVVSTANVVTAADSSAEPAPSDEELPAACPFCHEAMPVGRVARYCPYCGGDQRSKPCARCGEVLDHAWRYCISCGAAATTVPVVAAGDG